MEICVLLLIISEIFLIFKYIDLLKIIKQKNIEMNRILSNNAVADSIASTMIRAGNGEDIVEKSKRIKSVLILSEKEI